MNLLVDGSVSLGAPESDSPASQHPSVPPVTGTRSGDALGSCPTLFLHSALVLMCRLRLPQLLTSAPFVVRACPLLLDRKPNASSHLARPFEARQSHARTVANDFFFFFFYPARHQMALAVNNVEKIYFRHNQILFFSQ